MALLEEEKRRLHHVDMMQLDYRSDGRGWNTAALLWASEHQKDQYNCIFKLQIICEENLSENERCGSKRQLCLLSFREFTQLMNFPPILFLVVCQIWLILSYKSQFWILLLAFCSIMLYLCLKLDMRIIFMSWKPENTTQLLTS